MIKQRACLVECLARATKEKQGHSHTLHAVNEGCQSKEECLDLKVTQAFFFAFCFALKAIKVHENVIVKEPLLSARTESPQTPNVNGPPGALIVNL